MRLVYSIACVVLAVILNCESISGQLPPRLSIPGAVLLTQAKPVRRIQHNHEAAGPPARLRRPIPNAIPVPIRPVVEEPEEAPRSSSFDEEVNKLGLSVLQSAVRQAADPEEEEPAPRPQLPFRPERPIPVLRQDIRENNQQPIQRPIPVVRQEQREISRPIVRQQEPREEINLPIRQPQPVRQHAQARQQVQQQQPQAFRQPTRVAPRPQYDDDEDEARSGRTRKPNVQILRKYRTDNADGSITWGYENEDGSFKEETLGVDCVTRGKYGYIDPDGVRREYSYETGNKCDEPDEEEAAELALQNRKQHPQFQQPQSPQIQSRNKPPQFRPAPAQF